MITWNTLQTEVGTWVKKNFPQSPLRHQLMGLIEELGELTHAQLKKEQGIRGSDTAHIAAGKDAIADSIIYFMSACTLYGWAAHEVLDSETPAAFQAAHSGLFPKNTSPITHILSHLSGFITNIETAEFAAAFVADPANAESSALQWWAQERESSIDGLNGARSHAFRYIGGLAAYCSLMGWSLQDLLEEVWPKVQARDWTKNKQTGVAT